MRKIHQLEYAHRYESIYWEKFDNWTGLTAFGLSTFIAFTYQFPAMEPAAYAKLCILFKSSFFVPFGSTVVAVLTGVQIFLKPSDKSNLHRSAGHTYEILRHRIEKILTSEYSESKINERIDTIQKEWEDVNPPSVKPRHFIAGKKEVNKLNKYPEPLPFLDDIQSPAGD